MYDKFVDNIWFPCLIKFLKYVIPLVDIFFIKWLFNSNLTLIPSFVWIKLSIKEKEEILE